jgi:hypothetical protein
MMRPLCLVLALLAASASAFLPAPTVSIAPRSAAVVMRAEGGGVSRQQQLGSVLRGLGLAGVGAAFLSAGCVSVKGCLSGSVWTI